MMDLPTFSEFCLNVLWVKAYREKWPWWTQSYRLVLLKSLFDLVRSYNEKILQVRHIYSTVNGLMEPKVVPRITAVPRSAKYLRA